MTPWEWYEITESREITQGDLIADVPVISFIEDIPLPIKNGEIESPIYYGEANIMILSQACDLQNRDVDPVILCSYWPAEGYGNRIGDEAYNSKSRWEAIRRGFVYSHFLLKEYDGEHKEDFKHPLSIINFKKIFVLPHKYIEKVVSRNPRRLRLLPPYREHLSQSFARFFMRVGLPQDIVPLSNKVK